MNAIINEICKTAKLEQKTIEQMALKLSEETGEIAQAILALTQAGGSKYKDKNIDDVKEECIDLILVASALFFKLENESNSTDSNEILSYKELLHKKISKWQNFINS